MPIISSKEVYDSPDKTRVWIRGKIYDVRDIYDSPDKTQVWYPIEELKRQQDDKNKRDRITDTLSKLPEFKITLPAIYGIAERPAPKKGELLPEPKAFEPLEFAYQEWEKADPTKGKRALRQFQGVVKGLTGLEPTPEQVERIGQPGALGELAGTALGFIPFFAALKPIKWFSATKKIPIKTVTFGRKGTPFLTKETYRTLPLAARTALAVELHERAKTIPASIQKESLEPIKTLNPEMYALFTGLTVFPVEWGIQALLRQGAGKQALQEALKRIGTPENKEIIRARLQAIKNLPVASVEEFEQSLRRGLKESIEIDQTIKKLEEIAKMPEPYTIKGEELVKEVLPVTEKVTPAMLKKIEEIAKRPEPYTITGEELVEITPTMLKKIEEITKRPVEIAKKPDVKELVPVKEKKIPVEKVEKKPLTQIFTEKEVTPEIKNTLIASIKKAGGEYIGIQEVGDEPVLILFNDPKTKSTLGLPIDKITPKSVVKELAESRKLFGISSETVEAVTKEIAESKVPVSTEAFKLPTVKIPKQDLSKTIDAVIGKKAPTPSILVENGKIIAKDFFDKTMIELNTTLPDGIYSTIGKDLVKSTIHKIEDFRIMPKTKLENFTTSVTTVKKDEFIRSFERNLPFVDQLKQFGEIYNGMLLRITDKDAKLISCNGRTISISDIAIPQGAKVGDYIISNPKKILDAMKGLEGDRLTISIDTKGDNIQLLGNNGRVVTSLIDTKFPDVKKVFPEINQQVIIDKTQLLTALKELKPYANLKEAYNTIRITQHSTPEGIKWQLKAGDEEKYKEIILPVQIEDFSPVQRVLGTLIMPIRRDEIGLVSLDRQYLYDGIKNIKGNKVYLAVKSPTTAVQVYGKSFKSSKDMSLSEAVVGLKDELMSILEDERGSFSWRNLSAEQQMRIDDYLKVIGEKAKRMGLTVEEYLIRQGITKEVARQIVERKKDIGIPITSIAEIPKEERIMPFGKEIEEIIEKSTGGIVNKIKILQPKITDNKGISKIIDVTPEDINDVLPPLRRLKGRVEETVKQIKNGIHQIEMVHTYLRQYDDTKDIVSAINQATRKLLTQEHKINLWEAGAKKTSTKNAEALSKIVLEADRRTDVNIFALINKAVKEGILTSKDKVAYFENYYYIHKLVKSALIREILDSRLGIKAKSNGIVRYIRYTTKGNKQREGWIPEEKYIGLLKQYGIQNEELPLIKGGVEVLDTKEEVMLKWLDKETGKYKTKLVKEIDFETAIRKWVQDPETGKLGKETQRIINDILPYENYAFHNRIKGNYWFEVEIPTATGFEKVYSERIPNQEWGRALQKLVKMGVPQKGIPGIPNARITIKPHSPSMKYFPPFGTMADVEWYLASRNLDIKSEAGLKLINSYRSMSGLMRHFIHSKNLPGFGRSWKDIVEAGIYSARAALNREFKLEMKRLKQIVEEQVLSAERKNIALRYLDNLSNVQEGNVILDGMRALSYFSVLANKPFFIIQNILEPTWARARVNTIRLNKPLQFDLPLDKKYTELVKKAEREGLFSPMYMEEIIGKSKLAKWEILSRLSETHSSRKVYEIGLKLARDKGLIGKEAEKIATDFLLGIGKPFYKQPNFLILLQPEGAGWLRKYGSIFLRWPIHFINEFARAELGVKGQHLLLWMLGLGVGSFPFGRKLLYETKLIDYTKDPRKELTMQEKFLLQGFLGMLGSSSAFMTPFFAKGMGGYGQRDVFQNAVTTAMETIQQVGDPALGLNILGTQVLQADRDYHRYGLPGAIGHLPLGGAQHIILGATKMIHGVKTGQRKPEVIYTPETIREKLIMLLGGTPIELAEYRERKKFREREKFKDAQKNPIIYPKIYSTPRQKIRGKVR